MANIATIHSLNRAVQELIEVGDLFPILDLFVNNKSLYLHKREQQS
jgi:hypothetical protein